MLGRFLRVMRGMKTMTMGDVRVMGRRFMVARLVMHRGFRMMFCRVLMMLRCQSVVLCAFVFCHFVHLDYGV